MLGNCETSKVVSIAKASTKLMASPDKRGKAKLEINPVHEIVDNHIRSYNPAISHYRRDHAPKRLYLPHELTIQDMYTNFMEQNPDNKLHYSTYTRRINFLNISFAQLGLEECELCQALDLKEHEKIGNACTPSCVVFKAKEDHTRHVEEAQCWRNDSEKCGLAESHNATENARLQICMLYTKIGSLPSHLCVCGCIRQNNKASIYCMARSDRWKEATFPQQLSWR